MGKSQTRRLREATKRFGHEYLQQWLGTRAALSALAYERKVAAGLISPNAVTSPTHSGQIAIIRYSTYLSYEQNEANYGRPLK